MTVDNEPSVAYSAVSKASWKFCRLLAVQLTVVKRLRSEVMDESTECHTIVPTRREVGYVYVLKHTHTDRQLQSVHCFSLYNYLVFMSLCAFFHLCHLLLPWLSTKSTSLTAVEVRRNVVELSA